MSALALPFVTTNDPAIVGVATPINAEFLAAFEPVTLQDLPVNDPTDKFVIEFTFQSVDHAPRTIIWNYGSTGTSEASRDADFVLLTAALATTI